MLDFQIQLEIMNNFICILEPFTIPTLCATVVWLAQLGNGRGWGNPDGLQVGVLHELGTGYDSPTHELSNKSKNIFFGPKLREIQPILKNSSKLSPSFLCHFGFFWACFDR